MDFSSDIVQLIHKIGFYAAEEGDFTYAYRIFDGMRAIRPNSVYPHIGMAMALMLSGKGAESYQMLKKIKDDYPEEKDDIEAMMGFSLKFSNQDEKADEIFAQMLKTTKNKKWKEVAETFLKQEEADIL